MASTKLKKLKLSVGTLVEFSAKTGDLFSENPFGPSAREGIIGHQEIQKSRGNEWLAEYRIKRVISFKNYQVTLQGRIDLVNDKTAPIVIEEIKTTYVSPVNIPESTKNLHWAQAKIYAYLYFLDRSENQLNFDPDTHINVVLTWYDLTTKNIHQDAINIEISKLKAFTEAQLEIYLAWYEQFEMSRLAVISSTKSLSFPFKQYRPNQHNFARHVYTCIKDKKQLLVEAPTGTGKTLSTLFPAIKAIGESITSQIVYLTAKGSAQQTAIKTISFLQKNNQTIDFLVIQAKDKACPCRSQDKKNQPNCQSENGICNRTIGFFDRLPAARVACLNARLLTSEIIQKIAEAYQLCPFELSLQMIGWSSIVICDFNYVLDPMVKLSVFDQNKNRRVILIDEIHNLPDRAREMYSATLSSNEASIIAKQMGDTPLLKKQMQKLAKAIVNSLNENLDGPPKKIKIIIEKLLDIIGGSEINSGFGNQTLSDESAKISTKRFNDWLKQIYRYVVISELYDDSFSTLTKSDLVEGAKNKNVTLRLMCLDASYFLTSRYLSARSIIGFSATLSPLSFYLKILGFNQDSKAFSLPCPFPPENQLTIRCDYIDTTWQQRENSIDQLNQLILAVYHQHPGKYLVFFPSYDYMNNCYRQFTQCYTEVRVTIQNRASNELDRQIFLNSFFEANSQEDNIIGFAILGGIFGEGVDYVGDALTGTILIGSGMPQPTIEQKLIEKHYAKQGLNGFQFAYQYPGFARVKQTAGRVIRSEKDKGVVVLVEPRFKRPDYRLLMPEHWQLKSCKSIEQVQLTLSKFWNI